MKTILKTVALPLLLAAVSCGPNPSATTYPARVDADFTKRYSPDSLGVTGSDGTISIRLDDGSSLFMTGDCFLGKVVDGRRDTSLRMINNSLVHLAADGTYLGAIYGGTPARPASLCTPPEADTSRYAYWYWPGHGFQRGNTLYLYMTKLYQGGEGQWGFRFGGTDFIRVDMNDYHILSIDEAYDRNCPIHWGHCVLRQGDWYYVYGTRSGAGYDPAQLCVSRAKFNPETDRLGAFEYFDGRGWNPSPDAAAGCAGLDVSVSEQFSVFAYDGRYVLVTQRRAQQAGDIYSYVADTPVGPWRNKKLLYETTEQIADPELFTYNAMAHPQFINNRGELLICYNINSYNLQKPYLDVSTYRPVFLRVPMRAILE